MKAKKKYEEQPGCFEVKDDVEIQSVEDPGDSVFVGAEDSIITMQV